MVTAVSLNPSIDRTLCIKGFNYGGMNRVVSSLTDASGKGVNVALAARSIGAKAQAIGFLYRENGALIEEALARAGALCQSVWLEGAVRVNVKLRDLATGAVTEVNSSGAPVDEAAVAAFEELFERESGEVVALSGSVPPGCPKDIYARLIARAAGKGGRCILDAEGELLKKSLPAGPYLVKPNTDELEAFAGRKLSELADVREAALMLVKAGARAAVASMGARGALLVASDQCWYAPPLKVEPASTVGAGDAMVAGLAAALDAGKSLRDALSWGVASATAALLTEGTQPPARGAFEEMLGRVEITAVG